MGDAFASVLDELKFLAAYTPSSSTTKAEISRAAKALRLVREIFDAARRMAIFQTSSVSAKIPMAEAYAIGTHRITLTLSLGISLYPDHGKDVQTIVSNADTAMYYAKARGRNNFQLFAAGMTVHTVV